MATLREIRKKLKSIDNIKKITQAMEVVAASRLRRAQAQSEKAKPYAQNLKEILERLVLSARDLSHPLLSVRKEIKKVALVVVAADRGLCGGHNNSIFKAAHDFLQKYPMDKIEVIPIGRKAIEHFQIRKWQVQSPIKDWGGKITFNQIKAFADGLMQRFITGDLDEVWLVYTHFKSVLTRNVVLEKILNIVCPKIDPNSPPYDYIFEPKLSAIFAEILPRYCMTRIQLALNESYVSELAARILSMRAATKNAEELLESLTLVRNKVRQTGITREMIEIASGAESLKNG